LIEEEARSALERRLERFPEKKNSTTDGHGWILEVSGGVDFSRRPGG
jgi:hypothetical protein